MNAADALRTEHRLRYVEVRDGALPHNIERTPAFKRHRLTLDTDAGSVRKTFDKSQIQRALQKFAKSGAVVERRTDAGAMKAFMKLNYLTRRKHGIPPQPDRFFEQVQSDIIATGGGLSVWPDWAPRFWRLACFSCSTIRCITNSEHPMKLFLLIARTTESCGMQFSGRAGKGIVFWILAGRISTVKGCCGSNGGGGRTKATLCMSEYWMEDSPQ